MSNEMYTEMIMEQLDHSMIKEHLERFGYYSIHLGNLRIDLRHKDYSVHYVSELSLMMVDTKLPAEEWVELFLQPMVRMPYIHSVRFFHEQTGFEYPSAFTIDCEWFRRDWFDSQAHLREFIEQRITKVVPCLRQLIENRIAAKKQYTDWKNAFYSKYYKGNKS